jgi:hypothetical protein
MSASELAAYQARRKAEDELVAKYEARDKYGIRPTRA